MVRFPSAAQMKLISRGAFAVDVVEDRITVVQPDRPGVFFRVAGVLTLNGLDIVAAAAHTESGMALSEFQVRGDADVKRLEGQLEAAALGRIALEARVDERRHTYARRRKRQSAKSIEPTVTFDNASSETATVIEVSCRDDVGVLYRISRALSELTVAIWTARIQTIGDEVVDAFYVTHDGGKILDERHQREIERAVLHAIRRK
jgi:[protein-PII] uridylyltransferase